MHGLAARGDVSAIHEFHSESVGAVGACPQPKREVTVDPSVNPFIAVTLDGGHGTKRDLNVLQAGAGPTTMVQDAAAQLASAGMAQDHIHIEDFGWSEP